MKTWILGVCAAVYLAGSAVAWADDSKKAGERRARPTIEACRGYRKTAEQEAEALLKADLEGAAKRERNQEMAILEEVKPHLSEPDRTGVDLQTLIRETASRFKALKQRSLDLARQIADADSDEEKEWFMVEYRETPKAFQALRKPIEDRIESLIKPSSRKFDLQSCPAGTIPLKRSEVHFKYCQDTRGGGVNANHEVDYETERELWEPYPSEENPILSAESRDSLERLFKRKFQTSAHLVVTTQMQLSTGDIGNFDIYPVVIDFDKWRVKVKIEYGQLATEAGRQKFRKEYVEGSLSDKECLRDENGDPIDLSQRSAESADGAMASAVAVKPVRDGGAAEGRGWLGAARSAAL